MEKPSATSAASTAFCAAKIVGRGGHLWIDGNGKITAGNGTLDAPKPNAFSLVQIEDCPGSTPTCRASCYVHGLEKHAKSTHDLYRHNSRMIREIISSPDSMLEFDWAENMAWWISENCQGGFRWHVSGDVFSAEYAKFIHDVCMFSPTVNHWIYTRSFEFLDELMPVELGRGGNLVVNLSADADNWEAARKASLDYRLRICYLTSKGEVPAGIMKDDVIFPDYALRGGTPEGQAWFAGLSPHQKKTVCPVDFHGKSEQRRCGPCNRCMV